MLTRIIKELACLKNPEKARGLQRFFKTGKGEYGEGDVFWGITVPKQREVARRFYKEISLQEIEKLLHNKVHEHRLMALIMLTMKYKEAQKYWIPGHCQSIPPRKNRREDVTSARDDNDKKKNILFAIVNLYLRNTKWINNWDLVDLSAPNIVGEYLFCRGGVPPPIGRGNRAPTVLYNLAHSTSLWERRIAVLATFTFIRQNDFTSSLKIAEILLHDKQDLIHKAVGWMLREVGKRDKKVLLEFLNKHASQMPRVMLRYAMEKFDKKDKEKYL